MTFFEMLLRLERGVWLKARAENWRQAQSYVTMESTNGNKKLIIHHRNGSTNLWEGIGNQNIFEDVYEEVV